MASSRHFTLTLLGKTQRPVQCSQFMRKEFRDPKPHPKANPDLGLTRTPICPFGVKFFQEGYAFNDISAAFESDLIELDVRHLRANDHLSVGQLQEKAVEAHPDVGRNKAYDLYSRHLTGRPYPDLIRSAKADLLNEFKQAFEETETEHHMVQSRSDLGLHKKGIFIHPEIVCSRRALNTYRRLAKQGHLYSQYMAGLLLATSTGNYSPECIPLLLDAYENRHPEALDLLGRYLLVKDDYLGAFQCALLSCESGQSNSKTLIQEVMQRTAFILMTDPRFGMAPASFMLINVFLDDSFKELVTKHTDYTLYDPENPPMPAFLARQLGESV